eukprot:scaffold3795_cov200-Alexandrium_tamarense.AAC.1
MDSIIVDVPSAAYQERALIGRIVSRAGKQVSWSMTVEQSRSDAHSFSQVDQEIRNNSFLISIEASVTKSQTKVEFRKLQLLALERNQ